jgi:hypothetical protein
MLTPIGLGLNFIGSVVLLGSDVTTIENIIKQIDPVHYAYTIGLNKIIDQSMGGQDEDDNRAHPYDNIISANQWYLWPLRQFLNHYAEQNIPYNAAIDIRGGWFKINGNQLVFSEKELAGMPAQERAVEMPRGGTSYTKQITLKTIYGLIYEARMRRIYIYGVGMLSLGFLLQLIGVLL